ncbi:hypothetical protein BGW80DRAFT_1338302 [Lactifluus volemus]|nr:hypothetical protein BGW80DRAFT_1338302 [Lactifluus volemus]
MYHNIDYCILSDFRRHLRPSAVRSATRLASRPRCTPYKIKEFEAKVASKLLTPAQQPRTILIVAPGGGMVRDQLENNQACEDVCTGKNVCFFLKKTRFSVIVSYPSLFSCF